MRSSKFAIEELVVARLDPGDDVMLSIKQVAKDHVVTAASFTLIGAVDRAKFGFYNPKKRGYDTIAWKPRWGGPKLLEILACVGIVGQLDRDIHVHAHITLKGYLGDTIGGHLMEGCRINPTGELTLLKARGTLARRLDKNLNLALLSI